MMFRGKFERARNWQKTKMQGHPPACEEEDLSEKLEKNDTLAMILAAMLTFLPAALIMLAVICLAGWFFIFR